MTARVKLKISFLALLFVEIFVNPRYAIRLHARRKARDDVKHCMSIVFNLLRMLA